MLKQSIAFSLLTTTLAIGYSAVNQVIASEPEPNRFYTLTNMFLEKENKCLEGNKVSSPIQGGAAFMDNCQNVSGQLWKLVPAKNGYFRLKTMFLEKENKCLEGNQVSSPIQGGAAFMDKCQNVSGQLWKFKP